MAHSAEEKIKILYEDSLQEIRVLADRMEGISTVIEKASQLIDEKYDIRTIHIEASKLLDSAVNEQMNKINSQMWMFCLVSTIIGGISGVFAATILWK